MLVLVILALEIVIIVQNIGLRKKGSFVTVESKTYYVPAKKQIKKPRPVQDEEYDYE